MATENCITPNCTRPEAPALGRGLCMFCYKRAKTMVEEGKTTWDEIVGLGLAKPIDTDPFTKAFDKARKEINS